MATIIYYSNSGYIGISKQKKKKKKMLNMSLVFCDVLRDINQRCAIKTFQIVLSNCITNFHLLNMNDFT